MIAKPGFYELTASEYHADPCATPSLSSSLAVDMLERSPLHAKMRHPRLCTQPEREDSPSLTFGSVVHELALGAGGGFAVWPGDSWRGGEAAAFKSRASVEGRTAIKQADFDRAVIAVASMRTQLDAMGLLYALDDGLAEQVCAWQEGGHWCRAMFDRWIPERNLIVDIKTTAKGAHPSQIAKTVAAYNYDMRSQFYLRGASALTGIPATKGGLGFLFLFLEVEPPYAVVPCFLDDTFQARGRRRADEAISLWASCMSSGVWPSYTDRVLEISAPGWVSYDEDECEEIKIT